MATTFKNFKSNDLAQTRTLLHEAIPITGSIVSGTYTNAASDGDNNVKTYGHGMLDSVYDYPYLSSSANQIFDITVGLATTSPLSASTTSQTSKKVNIYNQMAQYLVGYDDTGSIKKFTMPTDGAEMHSCYFVPFSRLLTKDEIKKGSFTLELGVSGAHGHGDPIFNERIQLSDTSGSDGYYVDSPVGEYGVLYGTTSANTNNATLYLSGETGTSTNANPALGLIYYQAGIAVISGSAFNGTGSGGALQHIDPAVAGDTKSIGLELGAGFGTDGASTGFSAITASTIGVMANSLRNRIYNISFNNTTELNSTIYFCRASHTDFNYSSNPTYLSASKIRVKTRASDTPVSYFTTIGLYSADNELLAVAKLSEPLRKDPTNEVTLRVRLDY
jgi:hypothetical protein